jgi:hypothetical protein
VSRVAYIRAWPRDPATGAMGLVTMAGGGSHLPYLIGNTHYRAGIVREPRFGASLGFSETGWTGAAMPQISVIEFAPGDPALLRAYQSLYWKDAPIEVDAGEETAGVGRILTGIIGDATVEGDRLMITVADFGVKLAKPFIQSWFAGTGGIEGDATVEGRVKRRSFGAVLNVEGRILNAANNIYEFGDPAFPLQNFTAVRDMGRAGPTYLVDWQGSVAATLNALTAAPTQQGGAMVAPSIACVKWWTQPAGPLTADIQGENTGGYVETPVSIAARVLAAANGPAIVNQAAANAIRNFPAGLHIADDSETAASALDRLLLPVSLLWRFGTTGQIDVRPWDWSGSAEVVRGRYLGRTKTLAPTKTRRLGYARNHRQHSEGEIAADIIAAGVTYADGTTLEQLKPAEGGANVTGNHSAAAFAGQGALATRSDVIFGSHITSLPAAINPSNLISGDYLSAGFARYLDNVTVQALRPGEAGANITEGRVASAIAGQGAFATLSNLAYGSPLLSGFGALASLSGLAFGSPQLTGFGSLAGLGNLFFGSPYLLEGSGGAAASLSAFKTSLGIAGGFSGQGALATLSSLGFGSSLLTGFGGLAGRDTVRLGISGGMVNEAQNQWLTDGNVITGMGTAAAIAGQSPWATFATSTGVVSRLQSDGFMQASNIFLPNVAWLNDVFPSEYGANATEGRTAAAFAGQGALATRSSLGLGSSFLTGFGALAGTDRVRLGVSGGMVNEANSQWLTDGSVITGMGTAAAISGQTPWATLTTNIGVVSRLQNDGLMQANSIYLPGGNYLSTVFPAEYGANATEGRTAAAFAGQGALATMSNVGASRMTIGSPDNIIADADMRDMDWWRSGGGSGAIVGAIYGADMDAGWTISKRALVLPPLGEFDFRSQFFAVEPGASYRVRVRLWSNDTGFAGRWGAFIHMPGVQWFSLLTGQNNLDHVISSAHDTGNVEYIVKNGSNREWQFRFGGNLTGSVNAIMQISITRVSALGDGLVTRQDGVTRLTDAMAVTSMGTASGFAGQGSLATLNSLGLGSGFLTGFGGLAGRDTVRLGNGGGVVNEAQSQWLTDGSVITGLGTAAAIAGQSSWATFGASTGRVSGLNDSGHMESASIYRNNVGWLDVFWPQEPGANATEGRTAAAITGQTPWATLSVPTDRVSRINNDGAIQAGAIFQPGVNWLNNVWPQEAGANVTEGRTAAAFSGQGALATMSTVGASRITTGNPDNIIPDADMQDMDWWRGGGGSGTTMSAMYGSDPGSAWTISKRVIVLPARGQFDFTSRYFSVEPGASYRVRVRLWSNNAGFAGWWGAFIHMPGVQWFSLVTGQGNIDSVIGSAHDTGNLEYIIKNVTNTQWQFRFRGDLTGTVDGVMQISITRVAALGGLVAREDGVTKLTDASAVTSLGTAGGFAGQSAWATYTGLSTTLVEQRTQRLQSDGYIEAASIYKSGTGFLSSYWAQEGGANVTEGRTAAAVSGQSAWATYSGLNPSNVNGQVQHLQTDGRMDSANIFKIGAGDLTNYWPQEAGSNVTEGRTSSAIAGQSEWATFSGVSTSLMSGRTQRLQSDGYIESASIYSAQGGGFLSQRWAAEGGANVTGNHSAASVAGQGAFATQSWIHSGNVASFFSYSAFRLEYNITRFDGSTIVTENMVITTQGVAAGFVGQGIGATANNLAQLDPAAQGDINSLKGGKSTFGYGEIKKVVLQPGASVNVSGMLGVNSGGGNGSIRAQLSAGPSGGTKVVFASGEQAAVAPGEPGISPVSGIFTNSTGVAQLFEITLSVLRTPASAGGSINSAQSYFT